MLTFRVRYGSLDEYWKYNHSGCIKLQSLPKPAQHLPRLSRAGSTLWPLEGQMSVRAWSPAYFVDICRREKFIHPVAYEAAKNRTATDSSWTYSASTE